MRCSDARVWDVLHFHVCSAEATSASAAGVALCVTRSLIVLRHCHVLVPYIASRDTRWTRRATAANKRLHGGLRRRQFGPNHLPQSCNAEWLLDDNHTMQSQTSPAVGNKQHACQTEAGACFHHQLKHCSRHRLPHVGRAWEEVALG